ncbi:MAG: HAD-IA family hydrolase [Candidatus Doudnabacteria bacterium]
MNNIKAIGFDWGGVIVDFPAGTISMNRSVGQITGVDHDKLQTEYLKRNTEANVAGADYADVWIEIAHLFGVADKDDQIRQVIKQRFESTLNTQMVDLIKALKTNYKVGLLSNNNHTGAKIIKQQGLNEIFDVSLISAEIGFQKPSPEAFDILFQRLEVKPEETIFIDDSTSSLLLADQIGYIPILYKNLEQLTQELTNLNIKY